jgi:hypothetical protein
MAESADSKGTAGLDRLSRYRWPVLAVLAIFAVHVGVLRWEGRQWWCDCGRADLWWGEAWSAHTSQHLFDPYSFTHVLHGVLLCGLLAWLAPRIPAAWRFCMAVALEATWEVVENSNAVIDRYRTSTAFFGYRGDTVANSLGDVLSCAVGFLLARRLGWRWSLALFVVVEVVVIVWIRDSLTLEILMLFCPIDAIKRWQVGQG